MFSFRTTSLEEQLDKALQEGKVGCFCTQNCWDTEKGRYMYDIFRERGNLVTVFSPRDTELTPETNHIEFSVDELKELDAVIVEIQDVGSRYFNYTKDVFRLMEELKSLKEEACDLLRVYDKEKGYIFSHMRHCPSRGMLNDMSHMEPYHAYCQHCNVIYQPVLRKYGKG